MEDFLKTHGNKLKMEIFETKSNISCKISVFFAIFKAKKYKFFCLRPCFSWWEWSKDNNVNFEKLLIQFDKFSL